MTGAFAAATATLSADPNQGVDATHYALGSSIGVPVRVRLVAPDIVQELGAAPAAISDAVIYMAKTELDAVVERDVIAVGDETYSVMAVLQDAAGVTWRLPVRKHEAPTQASIAIGHGL